MSDKKDLQIAIGKNIREFREQKKITQQTLADDCGIEKSNFSRLETGNTNPTIYTLKKIADNLGIALEELVKV